MKELALENWYKSLSSVKQLSLREARDLFNKTVHTQDKNLQKEYSDELVLGTLHLLYKLFKKNNLCYLCRSYDEVNELISVFTKKWIEWLFSGEILEIRTFANIFSHNFIEDIFKELYGENHVSSLSNSKILFAEMFYSYYKLKREDINPDYFKSYCKFVDSHPEWFADPLDLSKYNDESLKFYFDKIYDSLELDKCPEISEKIFVYFSSFLVEYGLVERIDNNQKDSCNYAEKTERKIDLKKFLYYVDRNLDNDSSINKERNKNIIHDLYNLDGQGEHTAGSLSEKYNLIAGSISNIAKVKLERMKYANGVINYINYANEEGYYKL
jgi:hypothetical protein